MTERRRTPPPPLTAAASLAGLEGVALVAGAAVTLTDLTGGQVAIGLATTAFFGAYGAVLVAGGVSLGRGGSWARGPVLLTQLIVLGLAWNIRQYALVAVLLAVVAVVVVAGLVHPASMAVLNGTQPGADPPDEPDEPGEPGGPGEPDRRA